MISVFDRVQNIVGKGEITGSALKIFIFCSFVINHFSLQRRETVEVLLK